MPRAANELPEETRTFRTAVRVARRRGPRSLDEQRVAVEPDREAGAIIRDARLA